MISAECQSDGTVSSPTLEATITTTTAPSLGPDSDLSPLEQWWSNIQPFLESCGYMLRPRYRKGWTPSWLNDRREHIVSVALCEDFILNMCKYVLDATRMSDGKQVAIKATSTKRDERFIAEYLSSPELQKDPHNHCVPVLEIISIPDDENHVLIVMPILLLVHSPAFHCLPEYIEALRQFLETLEFMHRHNIAHRDACSYNMMMDPTGVAPRGFHFVHYWTRDGLSDISTRHRCQVAPVKYYLIDFGFSLCYPDGENARATGRWGQIKTIPEMQKPDPYNPFKADVYQVGASFLMIFKNYKGLDMFHPFLHRMTHPNPDDRPTAAEALAEFEAFVAQMDPRSVQRRIWSTNKFEDRHPPGKIAQLLCRAFPQLIRRL